MIVVVDSEPFERWTSLSLHRSLDAFVHSFDIDYSDQWSEDGATKVSLLGALVEIHASDGELLLTGYVDQARYSVSAGSVVGSTQGRSFGGDLVDCHVLHPTGHWANRTARQIITDVCEPFETRVTWDPEIADTTRIQRFDADPSDTAFAVIDRLCKIRGYTPVSTPDGHVRITRSGVARGARSYTLDLASIASRDYSASVVDLRSEYHVATQSAASDDSDRRTIREVRVVRDPNIRRYRPEIVMAEKSASATAEWVANQRVAASARLGYELYGAVTWQPGARVYVHDPVVGVDDTLILASARIEARSESLTTRIELAWPGAYTLDPRTLDDGRVAVKSGGYVL